MSDPKKSFAIVVLLLSIGYAVVYLVNQSDPNITSHVTLHRSVSPLGRDFKVARIWHGVPMYGYLGYYHGKLNKALTWYSYEGKIKQY